MSLLANESVVRRGKVVLLPGVAMTLRHLDDEEPNRLLESGLVVLKEPTQPMQHPPPAILFGGLRFELVGLFDLYREQLRRVISGGKWERETSPSFENRLIWTYGSFVAERDGKDDIRNLARAYRDARSALVTLQFELETSGWTARGIPIGSIPNECRASFDRHLLTLKYAGRAPNSVAGKVLSRLLWLRMLNWLSMCGAWEWHDGELKESANANYEIGRLSLQQLTHFAGAFELMAKVADVVQEKGVRAEMKRPPQGGRPIDYPMKWLILEARRQGMDVAALGKLIYERRNDLADFRGVGKTSLLRRLQAAWVRVPQSDPSLRTPTVAHNL